MSIIIEKQSNKIEFLTDRALRKNSAIKNLKCEYIYCNNNMEGIYKLSNDNGDSFLWGYCNECVSHLKAKISECSRHFFDELFEHHQENIYTYTGAKIKQLNPMDSIRAQVDSFRSEQVVSYREATSWDTMEEDISSDSNVLDTLFTINSSAND